MAINAISPILQQKFYQMSNDDTCKVQNWPVIPKQDIDNYNWIRILRMCIIGLSSLFLCINIALILKKKQYKFNTIKLFMFVQIFYVISLLSVITHDTSYNLNVCQFLDEGNVEKKMQFYNCVVRNGKQYASAIQGFINLSSYALSYWFAVCITLYIKHVLQNTHRRFMIKRGFFICLTCLGIVGWYSVPFGLAFCENVPFSFGSTGYRFLSKSEFFFYGGLVNRSQDTLGDMLVITWMLFLPLIMFAYHIYLLYTNSVARRQLIKLDEINPRQFFIIRSGKLSIVIFAVQIFNVFKLIFSIILEQFQDASQGAQIVLFGLNVLFDLMAFVLIYIYFRHYYKQGRSLQENSAIMQGSLISSFNAPAI